MGNGPSALHQAVLSGDVTAVRVAVQQQSGSLDASEPTNGWTPLHISAAKGYDVIARELLARGAAPNLIDKLGRTALHLAAAEGHSGLLRDLLRKGADPTLRDTSGKTALDVALEKQQGPAAGVLAEALAGRGVAASTTPTGSPTAWQARAQQQQQQQQQPAALDLGGLHIGSSGQPGGGVGAYPSVPQPADAGAWLRQLPSPPGVSISAPSAPPAPTDMRASAPPNAPPPNAAAPLPDYYDYLMPSTTAPLPPQLAPGAPPLQADAPPFSPYPAVPGAPAAPPLHAQPGPQQQQQQQQQQQWPVIAPPVAAQQQQQQGAWGDMPAAPPAVPAHQVELAADDEDDGWGVSHDDDDWGDDSSRPSASSAAMPGQQQQQQRQRQQQPDLVGAAMSGAGKVAGAVASTAVAGAKQLLSGLIPRPPGNDGSLRVPGPEDAGLLANLPGATTAGPPGRLYSYEDLARATQGFAASNKLGAGGYGPVYRGTLDGVPVAVKLLDTSGRGSQGVAEFQAEVGILSRLHHPHIVLLMGCCPARCALVYELLDHGSLEQHLFNPALPELAWQDRIRIACEVVSALLFLHSAPEPIVHMDLKPGNLLLNKSLVCKVGDVGLSRLMPLLGAGGDSGGGGGSGPVSTVLDARLVGTPSYMDPEYLRTGRYGPKSDTYSLGVILLQMLTGLEAGRVVAVVEAALARSQGDAASFAAVIDPRSGSWPITEAASFAHLGMRCVELARASRPDLRGEVLPALLQLAERARLYEAPRGLKRAASIGGAANPPSMFICPITQDVMTDPVFAADGYTYERDAIAAWLAAHRTSPMTNLPLGHSGLTPNLGLRSAIREWQEKHGVRR